MSVSRSFARRHPDSLPADDAPKPLDGQFERLVAANMAAAAAVIRASDGVIEYTNAQFDDLLGYARGELTGRHISVVNAATDQAPRERAHEIMSALALDGTWAGYIHNVRKDGSLLWTEADIVEVFHRDLGTCWITVQREATERRDAHDALRASEERFRTAFELSPAATILLDDAARIIDANDAFCDVTGYGRDELLDKPLADVTHPDDAALDTPFVAAVFRGARGTAERRYITRDGGVVPATLDASVVRAADGHPLYAVATVTR